MNVIIVTNAYPKENDLYNNAFVHSRVKNYIDRGMKVKIFIISKSKKEQYKFDGVEVIVGNTTKFNQLLIDFPPNVLLVHFLHRQIAKLLTGLYRKIPILIWVHGNEALGWYRRLFSIGHPGRFMKYLVYNTMQMYNLRQFVKKNRGVHWIFVSNWMKRIMEKDTITKVSNWSIIPNVIDEKKFSYYPKKKELRKKILMIRPFTSRKYANDIAVNALLKLSKIDDFTNYEITIIGDGPYFDKTLEPLKKFTNITIKRKFLSHEEIKKQHDKHGIFLCPTRQDSQGVSMCESMSSGLVPIVSDNTAIPEFVKHGETGLMSNNNPKNIANNILSLKNDPELFLKISKNASTSIQDMCRTNVVINQEVNLIKKYSKITR